MRKILAMMGCIWLLWASAAQAIALVRDLEVEAYIHTLADPILKTAGIEPSRVRIYLVQDDTINAFVAGGSKIFIHTGLIMAAEHPEMLAGVLAHEIGHISAGHLARGAEALENAGLGTILSLLLGGVAIAAGAGDAGAAVMSAGSHLSERQLLRHTRAHERAADDLALQYLDALGITSQGMVDMFTVLEQNERRYYNGRDPYMLTHPMSRERLQRMEREVEARKGAHHQRYPQTLQDKHTRVVAKLEGFLHPTQQVLRRYRGDNSDAGLYARAIALHREGRTEESLQLMDDLLKRTPNDLFLLDGYAQILYESGQLDAAQKAYERITAAMPDAPLALTGLAQTYVAKGDVDKASPILERLTSSTRDIPLAWRLLATVRGQQGALAAADIALAEEALLHGKPEDALAYVARALPTLAPASTLYLQAQDIKRNANQTLENK